MCIQCGAVGCRVQKAVLVKLALNFDTVIAHIAQNTNRDRLVIDIGARTAIGGDNPADHQFVILDINILLM